MGCEPNSEKLKQLGQRCGFSGVVMAPESLELVVKPNTMKIF